MAIRTDGERPKKILVAMYKLAPVPLSFLSYEDIVVQAFKLFPDEFSLRGYPRFPDSSDVHKPLYGILARKGFVKSSRKRFALTPRGLEIAQTLTRRAGNKLEQARDADRLSREQGIELERMLKSQAFHFFAAGQREQILDMDMFAFFGCTIRSRGSHFVGRVTTCSETIHAAVAHKQPSENAALMLSDLLEFLLEKFETEVSLMKKMKSA